VVTGGFERKQFSERVEQAFAYERPLTETFRYAHTMQHGTPEQCAALRVQAIQEQQRQVVQQAAVQQPVPEQRPQLPVLAPVQAQPPRPQLVPEVEQAPAAEQKRVRGPRL